MPETNPISTYSRTFADLRVTTESTEESKCGKQLPTDKSMGGSQSRSHAMLEPHTRRLLDDGAVYREHKLDAWQLERNYTLAVESRHGIIGESGSVHLSVGVLNQPILIPPQNTRAHHDA